MKETAPLKQSPYILNKNKNEKKEPRRVNRLDDERNFSTNINSTENAYHAEDWHVTMKTEVMDIGQPKIH